MELDEIDRSVLHALQLAPRASWKDLGSAIGVDAGTVARRWERMQRAGAAWITVVPVDVRTGRGPTLGAAVRLECEPGRADDVAASLLSDPWTVSIDRVTGRYDLLLEVVGTSPQQLMAHFDEHVAETPGVAAVQVELAGRFFRTSLMWRLDALSPAQQHRLQRMTSVEPSSTIPSRDLVLDVALALDPDPRMSVAELARRMGTSISTARRRLDHVLSAGALHLRCDPAQAVTGFPVSLTSWYRIPPKDLGRVGLELADRRSTRRCVTLASGVANLLVVSWLRPSDEVADLEAEIQQRSPQAIVIDRALSVRAYKRGSRALDDRGFATDPRGPDVLGTLSGRA